MGNPTRNFTMAVKPLSKQELEAAQKKVEKPEPKPEPQNEQWKKDQDEAWSGW